MIIQVEWNRADGLKTPPRIAALILDNCEKEPEGMFALTDILKKMVENMPDSWAYVTEIRLDDTNSETVQ